MGGGEEAPVRTERARFLSEGEESHEDAYIPLKLFAFSNVV
jgi:hypothetical protein